MKMKNQKYTESEVRKAVTRKLKAKGFDVIPMTGCGRRGFPDTMILGSQGSIFFVEFKGSGLGPREDQKAQIKKLNDRGIAAFVINDPKQLTLKGKDEEPPKGQHKVGTSKPATKAAKAPKDKPIPKIIGMDGNPIKRKKKTFDEPVGIGRECPVCLDEVDAHELTMFSGMCENCFESENAADDAEI